jgi:hypothetical protein
VSLRLLPFLLLLAYTRVIHAIFDGISLCSSPSPLSRLRFFAGTSVTFDFYFFTALVNRICASLSLVPLASSSLSSPRLRFFAVGAVVTSDFTATSSSSLSSFSFRHNQ